MLNFPTGQENAVYVCCVLPSSDSAAKKLLEKCGLNKPAYIFRSDEMSEVKSHFNCNFQFNQNIGVRKNTRQLTMARKFN